ncbi:MAG: tRNA (adenosine(37)-N6)-threonylcarbamoyltransferase complex transferase subunit TsaD [Acidobacteria bacterium 13_1_20CM_2_68_7]|nr:MAG: tRNA (adenosine(37)-N6)-threonylcarbamoyltransferase complex transferase subunit TsaD [Acidobacteria bacterium 13_1_20CM_2_68_7]
MDNPLILGIETSCDETAAAVLRGRAILSNVIASQAEIHREYGGVVPELASRHHLERIDAVIDLALRRAQVPLTDLDAVAVTCGPGLVGSLLVGLQAAKAIAYVRRIPLLGVNHLEGHLRSVFLEHPGVPFPAVSLIASGGHTSLYLSPDEDRVVRLARTRDDASGEAFDKVAKLVGLGYPGGPVVDRLARSGNRKAVPFSPPRMSDGSLDFSFSGFKTAVLRHAKARGLVRRFPAGEPDQETRDLLASFQSAVVEFMVQRVVTVARRDGARSICLSGGVACNSLLRARVAEEAGQEGFECYAVSPALACDNAAMIAEVGRRKLRRGETAEMTLNADPALEL